MGRGILLDGWRNGALYAQVLSLSPDLCVVSNDLIIELGHCIRQVRQVRWGAVGVNCVVWGRAFHQQIDGLSNNITLISNNRAFC